MIDITRILCPIDFSEGSVRALEHAVSLARWYDAKVSVMHVFGTPAVPVAGSELVTYVGAMPPVRAEDVVDEVRRFCTRLLNGGPVPEIVIREGDPVKEIVAHASRMPADLLVLGTHGRSGFERLSLGSVAEKVLRKVPCPVLTVPPTREPAVTGGLLFKTILCSLDFSPSSIRALEYAVSLAKEADARLVLLHVVEWSVDDALAGEMAHFSVSDYNRRMTDDASARLKAMLPVEARDWCRPTEIVTNGRAHREILRVAAETGASVIVMGVQGRGAVDLMVFGSTTYHVIRAAPCPVLTLRS